MIRWQTSFVAAALSWSPKAAIHSALLAAMYRAVTAENSASANESNDPFLRASIIVLILSRSTNCFVCVSFKPFH